MTIRAADFDGTYNTWGIEKITSIYTLSSDQTNTVDAQFVEIFHENKVEQSISQLAHVVGQAVLSMLHLRVKYGIEPEEILRWARRQ